MKVLHQIGSQTSEYYFCVSCMYGIGCINVLENEEHILLLAHLDGRWSVHHDLPKPLEQSFIDKVPESKKTSLAVAMAMFDGDKPDVMQSHMFDYHGMVSCREMATLLDLPMIGSPGSVMALTTDKWQSRAIVESMGVPVPKAELLREGDEIKMSPPFILKPCREDNSMGITLVMDESQKEAAIKTAFEFDDLVLCEQYIQLGRELRISVVESAEDPEQLEMLSAMEYYLPKDKPIRTSADKLTEEPEDDDEEEKKEGDAKAAKKPVNLTFTAVDRKINPEVDETLKAKLYHIASTSHKALGLRHYSLYDVRIDPDGNPYFIEASAYCSFAPSSAIVLMGTGEGRYPHPSDLFYRFANRAIEERKALALAKANSTQTHGMRQKA